MVELIVVYLSIICCPQLAYHCVTTHPCWHWQLRTVDLVVEMRRPHGMLQNDGVLVYRPLHNRIPTKPSLRLAHGESRMQHFPPTPQCNIQTRLVFGPEDGNLALKTALNGGGKDKFYKAFPSWNWLCWE